MKLFKFFTSGSGGDAVYILISRFVACHLVRRRGGNPVGKFGRWYYDEYFCEIILNMYQWFRRFLLKIIKLITN